MRSNVQDKRVERLLTCSGVAVMICMDEVVGVERRRHKWVCRLMLGVQYLVQALQLQVLKVGIPS